ASSRDNHRPPERGSWALRSLNNCCRPPPTAFDLHRIAEPDALYCATVRLTPGNRPMFELEIWINSRRGLHMKTAMLLKASTAIACIGLMAACTDLKPLQAQVDDLKAQVARAQQDANAAKDAANSAATSASSAQ